MDIWQIVTSVSLGIAAWALREVIAQGREIAELKKDTAGAAAAVAEAKEHGEAIAVLKSQVVSDRMENNRRFEEIMRETLEIKRLLMQVIKHRRDTDANV